MKRNMFWRGLVFGIIILFIGVGVQPVVAAEQKDCFDVKTYDVNIELCGLRKVYSAQLTNQQLNEIDVLFKSIKDDLDNVKTKEETIRIYSDAIAKLNRYGLLGDCNVKQVQKLIIGNYLKSNNNHLLNKLSENKQSLNKNVFCLICGHTDNTFFIPWVSSLLLRLMPFFKSKELMVVAFYVAIIRNLLAERLLRHNLNNPIALGNGIIIGSWRYSASGWVHTLGLWGVKRWAGKFRGQIFIFDTTEPFFFGAIGFTGIKIWKGGLDYYYLGFANYIHLETESL